MIVVWNLFIFIIFLFIQSGLADLGNMNDIVLKKRTSKVQKEESVQSNNIQNQQKKRKGYKTEEQKRKRNASVQIYRAKQTVKGLKE